MTDTRTFWLRLLCWCGAAAIIEGSILGLMIWLLFEALKAQFSFPSSFVSKNGPLTLFGLAGLGMGWLNARLIAHLWGVGWSAAFLLLGQTAVAVGVAWFVGACLVTPFSPECVETLVMVGILVAGSSALVLRFE